MPMETDRLMGRMDTEPILSVKRSFSIDTMVNFDGDGDRHGDRDSMCKQAFTIWKQWKIMDVIWKKQRHSKHEI